MIKLEQDVYTHYDKVSKKNISLSLIDMAMYHFNTSLEMQKYFLDRYILIYIQKGELDILVDSQRIELNEKDMLLLPPYCMMQVMQSFSLNPVETIYYTMEFNCSDFYFFDINEYLHMVNVDILDSIITEFYSFVKSGEDAELLKDAKLLMVISSIKKLLYPKTKNRLVAENVRIYINTNIMRSISIASISNEFKYNKDYLSKIFKNEYGISLLDYLNTEKMKMAKRLLFHSDMSINSIAQSLGYESANYFVKFFKYHEKMSPSKYRASNR